MKSKSKFTKKLSLEPKIKNIKMNLGLIPIVLICFILGFAAGFFSLLFSNQNNSKVSLQQLEQVNPLMEPSGQEETVESLKDEIARLKNELENKTLFTVDTDKSTWTLYENKEIGFSFRYPRNFGKFEIYLENGITGRSFQGGFVENGYFIKNNFLSLGGLSDGYSYGQGSSFLSFSGFTKKDGLYYLNFIRDRNGNSTNDFKPYKVLKIENQEILLIKGDENPDTWGFLHPDPYGGAFMNIPNGQEFKGIAVLNNGLPVTLFEEILKTFKFQK